jgi:hypothetical protein
MQNSLVNNNENTSATSPAGETAQRKPLRFLAKKARAGECAATQALRKQAEEQGRYKPEQGGVELGTTVGSGYLMRVVVNPSADHLSLLADRC